MKQDLTNRISVIKHLEKEILQEPNRLYRRKKLNELMSIRENLRLQFYTEHIQDLDLLKILESEAMSFIKFEERLITSFYRISNSELDSTLQNIVDTCEQCQFIKNNQTISQAKKSLKNIAKNIQKHPNILDNANIMTYYRLRKVSRCQTILQQYSEKNTINKPTSLECCNELSSEE